MADIHTSTEQVTVSVVGTTGSAATPQAAAVDGVINGTIARTPAGQPNLLVNVVPPMVAIAVRFANSFLTTFVGLITAAGIGVGAGAIGADFETVLQASAVSSLVVAGVETLKNLITIFGRLEGKYPLATGSI
jgi:hypothetical protein